MSASSLRRLTKGAALTALCLGLAGCSFLTGKSDDARMCPSLRLPDELSHITRYNGAGRNYADVAYSAEIVHVASKCDDGDTGTTVDLSFDLVSSIGPAARVRSTDFPYFIAVTDGSGQILNKSVFSSPVTFADGRNRAGWTESQQIVIPTPRHGSIRSDAIVIGLQPSQAELNTNLNAP